MLDNFIVVFNTQKLTSPVLQAVKVAEVVADEWRDLFQVMGSNPCC